MGYEITVLPFPPPSIVNYFITDVMMMTYLSSITLPNTKSLDDCLKSLLLRRIIYVTCTSFKIRSHFPIM